MCMIVWDGLELIGIAGSLVLLVVSGIILAIENRRLVKKHQNKHNGTDEAID